jgi:GrpB-like predicted nucleotidyltransferase (UPF0157 family)
MEKDSTRNMNEEEIKSMHVGEPPTQLNGPVILREYDPSWPERFEGERKRIVRALGPKALMVEHVGSTSVPGLAAKPIIDILLVVKDSAKEASYVPALLSIGYVLRIREPDWYEHRLLKGRNVNMHVFSAGTKEIERMLTFRNWLRENSEDRDLYLQTKRQLAQKTWKYTQNYADAKSKVVESIIAKALGARSGVEEKSREA